MKKFLVLLSALFLALGVNASESVYVGQIVNPLKVNEHNDLILYYTGERIDSLEILLSSTDVKNASVVVKGESAVKRFYDRLVECRSQYESNIKKYKTRKQSKLLELVVKFPKMHFTGLTTGAHSDYEIIYLDHTADFSTYFYNYDTQYLILSVQCYVNVSHNALAVSNTVGYDIHGDLSAFISFSNLEEYDTFTKMVSLDFLRERIKLKNELLKKNRN